MTKTEKLKEKLEQKTISASELRTLLKKEGAVLDRTKGSHEVWKLGDKTMTLATHNKDLKNYQMKQAKEFLYGTQKESE
ncbi:MAG: type II toxin-antitoxin system HicA family toxin [Bdellovibrionota bacterium]